MVNDTSISSIEVSRRLPLYLAFILLFKDNLNSYYEQYIIDIDIYNNVGHHYKLERRISMDDNKENNKTKVNKIVIIVIIIFLIILSTYLGYFVGKRFAVNTIQGEAHTLESVRSSLSDEKEELKAVEDEYAAITKEYQEAQKLLDDKDSLESEVQNLTNDKESLTKENNKLQSKINDSEKRLQKLEESIITKEGEPRQLVPGNFEVGKDINSGRYIVTRTNNKSRGDLEVNNYEELVYFDDDEEFGVTEYVISLEDGDELRLSTSLTFTPVEE